MADPLPCPKCQRTDPKVISFTWWGGALGPKMFSHVRCLQCGNCYNSKTGKSNATAIGIYLAVSWVVVIFVLIWLHARGYFKRRAIR